jgi:hypothetical protein
MFYGQHPFKTGNTDTPRAVIAIAYVPRLAGAPPGASVNRTATT